MGLFEEVIEEGHSGRSESVGVADLIAAGEPLGRPDV